MLNNTNILYVFNLTLLLLGSVENLDSDSKLFPDNNTQNR